MVDLLALAFCFKLKPNNLTEVHIVNLALTSSYTGVCVCVCGLPGLFMVLVKLMN